MYFSPFACYLYVLSTRNFNELSVRTNCREFLDGLSSLLLITSAPFGWYNFPVNLGAGILDVKQGQRAPVANVQGCYVSYFCS